MKSNVIKNFDLLPFSTSNSCCIISNSHTLLDFEKGESIDNEEVVIRLNAAPTERYEHQVGTRTDIRVLNGVLQKGQRHGESITPKDWISTLRNERILIKPAGRIANQEAKRKIDSTNTIFEVTPSFQSYLSDTMNHLGLTRLSTGLFSILVFINVFDFVRLYEFDFFNSASHRPLHYWEDLRKDNVNLTSHNMDLEKKFVTGYLMKKFDIRTC